MKNIFYLLLFSLPHIAQAQMGICYNAYVWLFSGNQTETDENMPSLSEVTSEFEALLSQCYEYDCHILQRRDLPSLNIQIKNENAVLSAKNIVKENKDSMEFRGAKVVIFGKVEKKKNNKVKFSASFQHLKSYTILIEEFTTISQDNWEDDNIRKDSLRQIIKRMLKIAYKKGETVTTQAEREKTVLLFSKEDSTQKKTGNFTFQLKDGSKIEALKLSSKAPILGGTSVTPALGIYRTVNAYTSGTEYQLFFQQNQGSYIYIMGSDLKTQKWYNLFPLKEQNAFVEKGEKIALPPQNYIQLDNTTGIDYLCVFRSLTPLEISEIKMLYENSQEGVFAKRITVALGDKLASSQEVLFEDKTPTFRVLAENNKVVVTIIEMEHK